MFSARICRVLSLINYCKTKPYIAHIYAAVPLTIIHFAYFYARMLDPDYYKVLLEIGVGRRFWQSNPSPENAHAFYVRVIRPLRRLQRRGVVEKLREITPTDDRTPIAVEIIGQVNLTK